MHMCFVLRSSISRLGIYDEMLAEKINRENPYWILPIVYLLELIYISVLLHMRYGALREPCGCRARRGTRRRDA